MIAKMRLISRNLSLDAASRTDVGRVRTNNEDRILAIEQYGYGIYLVADGIGGHEAGEVASEMAAWTISNILLEGLKPKYTLPSPVGLLKKAIEQANREIVYLSQHNEALHSMGTTATVGLRLDDTLYIGHVGDSRAYLIREGTIRQLTEDHSVVANLVKEGIITPDEAANHATNGILFRCLGSSDVVVVETITNKLRDSDSLVFCSDGLTAHIQESEVINIVKASRGADEACKTLIELANGRGGEDNCSVIVVNVKLK